jgi:hypothetical protein
MPILTHTISSSAQKDVYAAILKLDGLRKQGVISDAEFDIMKERLLKCP